MSACLCDEGCSRPGECRRAGRCLGMALKIGEPVPWPPRTLDIRPAFEGPGKASFSPARKPKR